MDLGFIGIIDIILIILFLVALIIGAKKGFLEKFRHLATGLIALIIAILFARQFADMLIGNGVFKESIYNNVYNNIITSEAFANGQDATSILTSLGFPSIIASYLASGIPADLNIASSLANSVYNLFMVIISFAILLVGCWILSYIIKLLIKLLRNNIIIRIVDGLLGVILYGFLAICAIYIIFFIISLIIQIPGLEGFRDFITVDMQLSNPDEFRISKYFYENNILINFFKLFFKVSYETFSF